MKYCVCLSVSAWWLWSPPPPPPPRRAVSRRGELLWIAVWWETSGLVGGGCPGGGGEDRPCMWMSACNQAPNQLRTATTLQCWPTADTTHYALGRRWASIVSITTWRKETKDVAHIQQTQDFSLLLGQILALWASIKPSYWACSFEIIQNKLLVTSCQPLWIDQWRVISWFHKLKLRTKIGLVCATNPYWTRLMQPVHIEPGWLGIYAINSIVTMYTYQRKVQKSSFSRIKSFFIELRCAWLALARSPMRVVKKQASPYICPNILFLTYKW